ncbi:MAG: HAMP domain-containing histidine kinase [Chitinispirillaceae bacterium]|nr:HAMP domain-containing histidine kinase [Chitinispirillaceae bacterium]
MFNHPLKTSLLLAGSYIALCSLYIWFSGIIAARMAHSLPGLQHIELYKGLAFVLISGILIFSTSFILLGRIRTQHNELIMQRKLLMESHSRILAGTFASGIAHDINNVLGAIDYGLSEIESTIPDNKREYFLRIHKSYVMIQQMTQRLQKIGNSQTQIEMKNTNINDFITQTVEFAKRHRKLKPCAIRLKQNGDAVLKINTFLFEQMLINLMINAADATSSQGIVELNVDNLDGQVSIEVHDNGPGISEDQFERVFQPFHTTKTDGSGLGLAMVKQCAELHNGTISIGKSPLGGALFKLVFPSC